MSTEKTLVTGGTGFIGSHLVEELINRGENVKCLVRKDRFENRIQDLKASGVKLVYGDILDKQSIKNAMDDVDKVYHLAAIARPMPIPKEEYFKVNVIGTRNILEACVASKVKKIVYTSSISAVGPTRNGNPVDENTPCMPVDTYGKSKLESEKVVREFFEKYKTPIVVVRYPVIFGPRDFATLKLFKAINTELFPVLNEGNAHFEFCYVKNLVQGIILSMEKGICGEIYHLSDNTYQLKEIYEVIAKEENKKLLYLPIPVIFFKCMGYAADQIENFTKIQLPFSSDTIACMTSDYWVVNIEKAKRELEYKQIVPLPQAVKETIKWYKKKHYLKN